VRTSRFRLRCKLATHHLNNIAKASGERWRRPKRMGKPGLLTRCARTPDRSSCSCECGPSPAKQSLLSNVRTTATGDGLRRRTARIKSDQRCCNWTGANWTRWLESSAGDVAHLRGRCLPQRDGYHEQLFRREFAPSIDRRQMKLCGAATNVEERPGSTYGHARYSTPSNRS
jgi:hypothetical protein